MKHIYYALTCLSSICLMIAFLFHGCSIFSPVGQAISQGYENTVSYFNGYYNAKRLFNEAEDEIRANILSTHGEDTTFTTIRQIPDNAKQKLGQVIDKCSNILAFHPTSTLVDDALLLIGKSFYYQTEYLKSERKFEELIAKYPSSPLVVETQLWYAQTEEKLGKLEEGVRQSEATISAAQTSDENEIETQAHQLLGLLYRRMKQIDKAVMEYEKVVALSTDKEIKADAQITLGDIYFFNGQYKKSIEEYLRTREFTSDIYSNYYSNLQISIAYRELGEYKEELNLIDPMIEDFRNKDHLPALLFERANNYMASGKRNDAIEEYSYIDTTYASTEYSAKSVYQLGILYEKEVGDYQIALKYYTKANSAAEKSTAEDARRKYTALTRYFDAQCRLIVADSLFMVLKDTTRKKNQDTLMTGVSDTIQHEIVRVDSLSAFSKNDSLKWPRSISDSINFKVAKFDSLSPFLSSDSLKVLKSISDSTRRGITKVDSRSMIPSVDSLKVLKSIAAQELGDIFYSEVVVPDSAFYWYNQSLVLSYNSARSPRILYILAELSRTNPEKKIPAPEEYYTRLDHDFSESIYAEEARRFLGKVSSTKKADTAAVFYEQAEKFLDKSRYEKAIEKFHTIIKTFPNSSLAAKSQYAIGWILENYLAQPESALVQYKYVVKNYAATMYAPDAAKRLADIERFNKEKEDTIKTNATKIDTIRTDTTKTGTIRTDTTKTGTIKSDTTKADTIKTEDNSMNRKYRGQMDIKKAGVGLGRENNERKTEDSG